ncbi:MAG: hypothetical protein RMM58_07950 [Chloroflexota bacterium]|nr:hypothetical protein [Dehalococcoidia bacterium]MDW8253794.1 hypothetical protein [Chloroflexota bacterium]
MRAEGLPPSGALAEPLFPAQAAAASVERLTQTGDGQLLGCAGSAPRRRGGLTGIVTVAGPALPPVPSLAVTVKASVGPLLPFCLTVDGETGVDLCLGERAPDRESGAAPPQHAPHQRESERDGLAGACAGEAAEACRLLPMTASGFAAMLSQVSAQPA